jgi:ABC-type polysaccharide/polyol phosphate transport system ATPase subunit
MYALKVENMGVKFKLSHMRETTLKDTVIQFFKQKGSCNSIKAVEDDIFWALRNVSFAIKQGESFGVIGHNGAGKSTLLQILTGIYKPDEGTVERRGRIGLLQLGTGFHPELSGRDNIFLNGAILGLKNKEIGALYDSIVEFSELERFIDMPVKSYSSGMTARLSFSIAINISPDILLVDEVLSVGDEHFRKKSRLKLDEVRTTGKTVVLVTHNLGEIRNTCDRAICLNKGQLVFEGTGNEAVDYYLEDIKRNELKQVAQ